ncbi:MAG: 7-cyano-7-deazaguanine synthase [Verrucomicrobiota bacterium]|jgi:7-cyano-7-deazaguanine synthase
MGVEKRAVVLLSGGLDSATALAIAKAEGFGLYALTMAYGQRHHAELEAAKRVAESIGVEQHRVLGINNEIFRGSALTDNLEVPKFRSEKEISSEIPITYVPARNTLFLSYALAWGETVGATNIFIGVNALDYSGYPDCRPEFIEAFEKLANLATKSGAEGKPWEIHAPLIRMSKAEIIQRGLELGVDYSLTHSCYDPLPDGRACGQCDSCQLRRKGFRDAGLTDRIQYAV